MRREPCGAKQWAALAVLASLAASSCGDRATGPDHHNHDGGGDVCENVAAVAGIVLVSHSDTLYTQWLSVAAGAIAGSANGLVHGIHVTFQDSSRADIRLANDCARNHLRIDVADTTVARVTRDEGLRWYFNVQLERPGSTSLAVGLLHDGGAHFTSAPISVNVAP